MDKVVYSRCWVLLGMGNPWTCCRKKADKTLDKHRTESKEKQGYKGQSNLDKHRLKVGFNGVYNRIEYMPECGKRSDRLLAFVNLYAYAMPESPNSDNSFLTYPNYFITQQKIQQQTK